MKEGPNGSPENIRASVEDAIKVLPPSVKSIDIFECARVDPNVQIETSVQALAELVKEGKIGGVGLSEANANTIRRAHAVHPIAAVEIELSPFTSDPLQNGISDTCHERKFSRHSFLNQNNQEKKRKEEEEEEYKPLPQFILQTIKTNRRDFPLSHQTVQIPIAAYSPVSRGFLTGSLRTLSDLSSTDFRRMLPRFQPENFPQNLKLVEAVGQIAERKQATLAQVAIGWVCAQGAIPIPGSTKAERVEENCKVVELSDGELEELGGILEKFPIGGERYGGVHEMFFNA